MSRNCGTEVGLSSHFPSETERLQTTMVGLGLGDGSTVGVGLGDASGVAVAVGVGVVLTVGTGVGVAGGGSGILTPQIVAPRLSERIEAKARVLSILVVFRVEERVGFGPTRLRVS